WMLERLYRGRLVWLQDPPGWEAGLTPAGFRLAYREYRACLAGLLPVSHEQVAHSRVLFARDQWQLDEAARERLDLVARYAVADPKVHRIRVAGHADAQGRQLRNLELSRQRAEAVARYLMERGVAPERIQRSHHAHLEPAVAGSTAEALRQNRRVSIQLERGAATTQGV